MPWRLEREVFCVVRDISFTTSFGRRAREWIAQRVEHENLKATDDKLDW